MVAPTEHVTYALHGQNLGLLADKAALWHDTDTLLVADLHLGKATHFRKAGIAIPHAVEQDNLDRLSQLLLQHPIQRILILGDLFHSRHNGAWLAFKDFLALFHDRSFVLVMGNHDILAPEAYAVDNLSCCSELTEGPFLFTHEPLEKLPEGLYNVYGHIHPAVRLRGAGLQSLKLPCFHFHEKGAVLPAFGGFTGTAIVTPAEGDVIYGLTEDKVIRVL